MTLTTKLLANAVFLAPMTALAQTVAPVVVQAPSTLVDLSAITQPVLAAIGATIAGLIAVYVPKAIAAFERRTGIVFTENQRKTYLDAVQTGAGVLETKLDQGILKASHINVTNDAIRTEAEAVIKAAPTVATSLNLTVDGVARELVGAVNTGAHGDKSGTTVEVVAPDNAALPKVIVP